jgi:RNA polymerase sigma-70 factor (ECF subfamily)
MRPSLHQKPKGDGRESDAALLDRIRGRDLGAFEDLYRAYHARLTLFLYRMLRRPHIVEEVLNDTLMVVWDKSESFKGTSKVSTWIFGIAYRKALKALRAQDDPVEDDSMRTRMSLDPSPEDELGRRRVQAILTTAIAGLSREQRAVVELTYFHEMGYREIAEIMQCPLDTVKTRMFHARRHLRRRLSGDLPDFL